MRGMLSREETLLEGDSLRERLELRVVEVMMRCRLGSSLRSFCDVLEGCFEVKG